MTKDQFNKSPYVNELVFNLILNNVEDEFEFAYMDKKSNNYLEFVGIYDAYQKYKWNFKFGFNNKNIFAPKSYEGNLFEESEIALNSLRKALVEGIQKQDESYVREICIAVCEWGGVLGSSEKGNLKIINSISNSKGLITYLRELKDKISEPNFNLESLDNGTENFIFNSGFTKIYSLLFENWIIFDSRVSAAISLLIFEFYIRKRGNFVCFDQKCPSELSFPILTSRDPTRREIYTSKPASSVSTIELLKANIRANWLLGYYLSKNESSNFLKTKNPLRAFEASLFMLGYDIKSTFDTLKTNELNALRENYINFIGCSGSEFIGIIRDNKQFMEY